MNNTNTAATAPNKYLAETTMVDEPLVAVGGIWGCMGSNPFETSPTIMINC